MRARDRARDRRDRERKNFKLHGHDLKGCDMIVCWKHNWKEVPADIEVIELCRLVGW